MTKKLIKKAKELITPKKSKAKKEAVVQMTARERVMARRNNK